METVRRRSLTLLLAAAAAIAAGAACSNSPSGPSSGGTAFLQPSVAVVTPEYASSIVATPIVIRGEGFAHGATVSFGGEDVTATVINQWHLTVLVPPRPPGSVALVVRNPNGRTGTFNRVFRFETVEPIAVSMRGRVVAGAAEVPLAGATVDLPQIAGSTFTPSSLTDGDGRFELAGTLPLGVQFAAIRVTRADIGAWTIHLSPSDPEPVIKLTDLMLIRPGLTVRGDLQLENALWCTFESVACHRLVVDGPAGSAIDVEIVPESGQIVGLILDESFRAPSDFPTKVRVAPRVMWVMGGLGRYTITAK